MYFSPGHMSMYLSSLLAAFSFHRVPLATGTNIQVASLQGCTPGLAGSEPSGTFIHQGKHLYAAYSFTVARSRGA